MLTSLRIISVDQSVVKRCEAGDSFAALPWGENSDEDIGEIQGGTDADFRGSSGVCQFYDGESRGGSVLCEEGNRVPQNLRPLSRDGHIGEPARNTMRFRGQKNGFKGDFRGMEWAGVPFRSDGTWLLANLQAPVSTFAITGPQEESGL